MKKRANKFLVGTCCFTMLLVQSGACAAFGFGKLPGMGGDSDKQASSQSASATGDCVPAGQGGKVGFTDKLKAKAVNKAIDVAMEKIAGVEGVFLIQDKIANTCMADQYLGFSERSSKKIATAVVRLGQTMVASLKNEKERMNIESASHAADQELESGNPDDAVAKAGDVTAEFNKAMEANAAVDKEKLAEIWVDSKKLAVRDVEMLSLVKHIASFAKENMDWSLKNVGKLKPLLSFAKGLAGQAQTLMLTPKLISAHFDEHDKGLLEKAEKRKNKILDIALADEDGINAEIGDELGG